jgi:hypothetical protein
MFEKDYTPTPEQISLHGLGFIQLKLAGSQRMHVWHPDLPRRTCYDFSAIHNHRFSFDSRVLIGTQINRRYNMIERSDGSGSHDVISHDGPRSEQGGRVSFVSGQADVAAFEDEEIAAGVSYHMPIGQYHETPNTGVVVTIMTKLVEGTVHACSLIERGHIFDQAFDRYQLPAERLWQFVVDALRSAQ